MIVGSLTGTAEAISRKVIVSEVSRSVVMLKDTLPLLGVDPSRRVRMT